MGRTIGAVIGVFVAWAVLDFVIHGIILMPDYRETQQFWRAEEEMKRGLMNIVTLTCAVVFVLIYRLWIQPKNLPTGVKYGLLYGAAWGMSFGYGMYAVMPIPYRLALIWFWGTLIEAVVAGVIVGMLIKEETPAPTPQD